MRDVKRDQFVSVWYVWILKQKGDIDWNIGQMPWYQSNDGGGNNLVEICQFALIKSIERKENTRLNTEIGSKMEQTHKRILFD